MHKTKIYYNRINHITQSPQSLILYFFSYFFSGKGKQRQRRIVHFVSDEASTNNDSLPTTLTSADLNPCPAFSTSFLLHTALI